METSRPDIWTISWKEALRREHEYQKKVEIQQQHIDKRGPPTAVQQKLKCDVSLQQISATHRCHLNQWPSLQNQLHRKSHLQQPQSQQNHKPFWNKGPMSREKLGQQTSMFQQYWCHFCMVNCASEVNFLLHLHGQKHRLNMQELRTAKNRLLEKGVTWCDECNIPCIDIRSLAQHRQGRKHQARMEMLAKGRATGTRAAFAISNT